MLAVPCCNVFVAKEFAISNMCRQGRFVPAHKVPTESLLNDYQFLRYEVLLLHISYWLPRQLK